MDIGDILRNQVRSDRIERLKNSDQMTLGELIARLEPILDKQGEVIKKYGGEATVSFDFEYATPTGLSSWRGSYDELAITFDFIGYEHFSKESPKHMMLSEFIKMLKDAIGKEYTGWKGGEFIMGKTTPLWVANDGNSGNTAVIGVLDEEYSVVLITGRREY